MYTMDFNDRRPDGPTLDDDILLSIFELAVNQDSRLALHLTHICSHWRDLCLTSSFLWSHITVVNDFMTSKSAATYSRATWYAGKRGPRISYPEFSLLQHHLYHSRARLLDISVVIRMPSRLAKNDETTQTLNGYYDAFHHRSRMIGILLSRHSNRVRVLKVKSESYRGASMFFEGLHAVSTESAAGSGDRSWGQLEDCRVQWTGSSVESFPRLTLELREKYMLSILESIDLATTTTQEPETTPPLGATGHGALAHHSQFTFPPRAAPLLLPNLKRVAIQGIAVDWAFFAPANLEELYLSDMHDEIKPTFNELKDILVASQQTLKLLSLMNVCVYSADDEDDEEPKKYVFPALHTITLGYVDPRSLNPLTTHLRLPALKNLNIRNLGGRQFENTADGLLNPAEIIYFASTHALFTRIASFWDIHNLYSITLAGVLFLFNNVDMPPDPLLHLSEVEKMFNVGANGDSRGNWVGNPWYAAKMLLPFDFWQKCQGLKKLVLVRPDTATLYSLCCPAPGDLWLTQEELGGSPTDKSERAQKEVPFDYDDGSWVKTPSGGYLRVPVPRLEKFGLYALSKEEVITIAKKREGLLRKIVGGKAMVLTSYMGHIA